MPHTRNDNARQEERTAYVARIVSAARRVRATTPHADYLRGLQVAADAVHASCAHGTVVLSGSGLQDTGAMNFARDGLLEADGDEVVAFLREQGQLPDLRELRVVLAGFGDTTDPQKTLDQAHRDRLLGIWRAVLTAAGAEVQVDGSPRSGAAPASVPEVTTVDVPDPAPFPHTCSIRNFRLPDTGAVGFQENTPALREPTAARQAVEQIVAALRACPGVRIQLTGATSSYGDQTPAGEADRRWLSLARADAVRGLMTAAGLDASRIEIRGDGYHFDGYVPDRDGAGVLLPGPAAQNRCVLVSLV